MCIYLINVSAACIQNDIHFATHVGPASQECQANSQPREPQITSLHRALIDAGVCTHDLLHKLGLILVNIRTFLQDWQCLPNQALRLQHVRHNGGLRHWT